MESLFCFCFVGVCSSTAFQCLTYTIFSVHMTDSQYLASRFATNPGVVIRAVLVATGLRQPGSALLWIVFAGVTHYTQRFRR